MGGGAADGENEELGGEETYADARYSPSVAPIHDALLIEAPLDELDQAIATTKSLMLEASRIVLDGFELGSDVKVVRYPDRYMDKRGVVMWDKVMSLIGESELT